MQTVNESMLSQQKQKINVLWSVKYCAEAGTNLIVLIYELSQGSKILSDQKEHCGTNDEWQ